MDEIGMGWDMCIMKFSRTHTMLAKVPHHEKHLPLGSSESVRQAVLRTFEAARWVAQVRGEWESGDGAIEFTLDPHEPPEHMMLNVRATAAVVPLIVRLCLDNEWQGIDSFTGSFLEHAQDPAEGLQDWCAYRDQITALRPD